MTPGELLERLGGGRKVGADWAARCPVHADRGQSLTVTEGRNGQGRVRCSAGCDYREILRAIAPNDGRSKRRRRSTSSAGREPTLQVVTALPAPELAAVLEEVEAFLRSFVVLSDDAALAVVLWTAHGYAFAHAETTPYLAVTSPEKRSGKSRLLDVLELVVLKPWRAVTPSEAVVYRKVEADEPTLLLDEIDAIFGPRAREQEGLRALLNAGFRRQGSTVPRCFGEGSKMQVKDYQTFCPKALAGIGELPDTVADRSIPIRMQRRRRDEEVERFRYRIAAPIAETIRDQLREAIVGVDHLLAQARPQLPDELDDRAQDGWEPLLAIAEAAGGEWAARARQAAITLSAPAILDDSSAASRLLSDVRDVFGAPGVGRIATEALIDSLAAIEEAPWGEWRGRRISGHAVARLLRRYEIGPKTIRLGEDTAKGYLREWFEDAWERYLPRNTHSNRNIRNIGSTKPKTDIPEVEHNPPALRIEDASFPLNQADVTDVPLQTPESGASTADRGEGDAEIERLLRLGDDLGLTGRRDR